METIHERLEQLMTDLTATIEQAITEADERAASAKAIIEEQLLALNEAADTLYTVGDGAEKMADLFGQSAERAYHAADILNDYIESFPDTDEPEAPSTDHTFEGYCKKCGKELYYDDYLVDTPVGRLCDECHAYYMEHGTLDPVEEPWPMG